MQQTALYSKHLPARPPPYGDFSEKSICFCESRRTTKDGRFTACLRTLKNKKLVIKTNLYVANTNFFSDVHTAQWLTVFGKHIKFKFGRLYVVHKANSQTNSLHCALCELSYLIMLKLDHKANLWPIALYLFWPISSQLPTYTPCMFWSFLNSNSWNFKRYTGFHLHNDLLNIFLNWLIQFVQSICSSFLDFISLIYSLKQHPKPSSKLIYTEYTN